MKPGDIVFFDTYKLGHVGIYIGNGKFLGAQTSTGVAIEDMTKEYWKERLRGRVIRIDRTIIVKGFKGAWFLAPFSYLG